MAKRLVAWGAYDDGKPRVRLLLDALRRRDALAGEIHVPVWTDVADKSIAGKDALFRAAFRYLAGMPRAFWQLLRLKGNDPILLPYPGTPDVFLAAIAARLRGRKLVLDAFLPIHDTIVRDRAMLPDGGLASRLLRRYESAGLHLADVILTDTDAQAAFLASEYAIDPARFETVLVGAEPLFGREEIAPVDDLLAQGAGRRKVLFYGQFIPLHGISTILEAVRLTEDEDLAWIVVGNGQEVDVMETFLREGGASNLQWLRWVDYTRLPSLIAASDLCLGIFGASDKAARVIPNKLFQQLAMGKRVITRESPAIETLAARYPDRIITVPAEDPVALADAVVAHLATEKDDHAPVELRAELSPDPGVVRLLSRLEGG